MPVPSSPHDPRQAPGPVSLVQPIAPSPPCRVNPPAGTRQGPTGSSCGRRSALARVLVAPGAVADGGAQPPHPLVVTVAVLAAVPVIAAPPVNGPGERGNRHQARREQPVVQGVHGEAGHTGSLRTTSTVTSSTSSSTCPTTSATAAATVVAGPAPRAARHAAAIPSSMLAARRSTTPSVSTTSPSPGASASSRTGRAPASPSGGPAAAWSARASRADSTSGGRGPASRYRTAPEPMSSRP